MNQNHQTATVLIVDDEEMVLTTLRSFLALETSYEVVTFTSPNEALGYLPSNDVDLVLSDFMMPEMDGVSFLAKVREVKPEIPRILLTGYADKENAIRAINEVGLYHYIQKPWDNSDLLIILRNGVEKRQWISKFSSLVHHVNQTYGELEQINQQIYKAFS